MIMYWSVMDGKEGTTPRSEGWPMTSRADDIAVTSSFERGGMERDRAPNEYVDMVQDLNNPKNVMVGSHLSTINSVNLTDDDTTQVQTFETSGLDSERPEVDSVKVSKKKWQSQPSPPSGLRVITWDEFIEVPSMLNGQFTLEKNGYITHEPSNVNVFFQDARLMQTNLGSQSPTGKSWTIFAENYHELKAIRGWLTERVSVLTVTLHNKNHTRQENLGSTACCLLAIDPSFASIKDKIQDGMALALDSFVRQRQFCIILDFNSSVERWCEEVLHMTCEAKGGRIVITNGDEPADWSDSSGNVCCHYFCLPWNLLRGRTYEMQRRATYDDHVISFDEEQILLCTANTKLQAYAEKAQASIPTSTRRVTKKKSAVTFTEGTQTLEEPKSNRNDCGVIDLEDNERGGEEENLASTRETTVYERVLKDKERARETSNTVGSTSTTSDSDVKEKSILEQFVKDKDPRVGRFGKPRQQVPVKSQEIGSKGSGSSQSKVHNLNLLGTIESKVQNSNHLASNASKVPNANDQNTSESYVQNSNVTEQIERGMSALEEAVQQFGGEENNSPATSNTSLPCNSLIDVKADVHRATYTLEHPHVEEEAKANYSKVNNLVNTDRVQTIIVEDDDVVDVRNSVQMLKLDNYVPDKQFNIDVYDTHPEPPKETPKPQVTAKQQKRIDKMLNDIMGPGTSDGRKNPVGIKKLKQGQINGGFIGDGDMYYHVDDDDDDDGLFIRPRTTELPAFDRKTSSTLPLPRGKGGKSLSKSANFNSPYADDMSIRYDTAISPKKVEKIKKKLMEKEEEKLFTPRCVLGKDRNCFSDIDPIEDFTDIEANAASDNEGQVTSRIISVKNTDRTISMDSVLANTDTELEITDCDTEDMSVASSNSHARKRHSNTVKRPERGSKGQNDSRRRYLALNSLRRKTRARMLNADIRQRVRGVKVP